MEDIDPIHFGIYRGFNTGKGENLSKSQAAASLAAAEFRSLSGVECGGPVLYNLRPLSTTD